MVKTGSDHRKSLMDGRSVYINSEKVDDVTTYRAFARSVTSACNLYDYQAANLEKMTFRSPTSGKDVNRLWQLPKSHRDLVTRRKALEAWAETTCGMLGRSPDHVGSSLAGMYMGRKVFEKYDPKRAKALVDYFEYARDNDLYLSYVIINPQADKSRIGIAARRSTSSPASSTRIAKGSRSAAPRCSAPAAIFANELLVAGFMALQPGEEAYAFTAMVPMNAKGLKLSRANPTRKRPPSVFDYPLSSQFDENDAIIYFDDVKIPWDRVLVHRDLQMGQAQWFDTRAHVYQNYQCQIRLMVKLRS